MAYGLKYYHQYNERGDYLHRIEILGKDFSGSPELIITSTGDPVIRRHSSDKTTKKIIQGKELQFSFFCLPGDVDKYDEIFESDYKDYKIRYYVAGPLVFEGWLMPENLSREYFKDKYIINLSATDGLARLRNVEFRDASEKIIEGKYSLLEIIKYAVAKIDIEFDFRIQLGTYEKDWMSANECALDKIEADGKRFIKDDKPLSCYEVIEHCLKSFSCTLKQQDGYYQITNKHEGNSYQFIFDYTTLTQQSRTTTNKIVDLSGYFYEKSELNKIPPLKDVGITFRNKSIGTTISTDNLDDWAGSWIHTFDTFTETDDEVKLNSGATWEGDYIELTNDFAVTKDTDYDYIVVSFNHQVDRYIIDSYNCWPGMRVLLKTPSGYVASPWIPCTNRYSPYNSGILAEFRVHESGNYNIRIIFNRYQGDNYGTYDFFLKHVRITKGINTNVTDPATVPLIAMDEYYIQTLDKNIIKLEYETLLGDGSDVNHIGSFFYNNAGTYENTSSWNSYGHTENIKILDIWARNELNNRNRYKNYLKLIIHDLDNTINMDSILLIGGKYYTIVSFLRNEKKCIVTCDIVELLTTYQSYDLIYYYYLGSIDDETRTSPSTTSSIEHNELPGLQGGVADQYYHFYETEYTELHNWLNNVVLSDIGGIDMDDVLKVDTIQEHTADAGINAEGVHLEDGGITLGTGPAVDTIETTLTNDDSHMPTSGAVYDAIDQTALGYVNVSGTPADNQIAVFKDANTIEGNANFIYSETTFSTTVTGQQIAAFISTDTSHARIVIDGGTGADTMVTWHKDGVAQLSAGWDHDLDVFSMRTGFGPLSALKVFEIDPDGATKIYHNFTNIFKTSTSGILVNNIAELTPAAGVTIEGIDLQDSNLSSVNSLEIIHDGTGSPIPLKVQYSATSEGLPGDLPNYLTQLLVRNNTAAYNNVVTYIAGTTGNTSITFGDSDSYARGIVDYDNNNDSMQFRVAGGAWGLKLTSGGITLLTGATVNTIETTLTNDATHIPTSGAVYDAIAGASPSAHASTHENGGGDEISVAGLSGLLADGQTPLSHTHGNITNAGAIGSTADLPIITTGSGVLTVGAFGTSANTFCEGNDSRLSDNRDPNAHVLVSASHTASGLTIGHFLKALSATTFGFAAHGLTYSDVGAAASSHTHPWSDITGEPTTLAGYGISDTMSNFDTACNNGNFAFAGGAFHDGFSDFVGNEHINHTSVSMSTAATSGLNGGGTIAATRNLVLAINRLTAVTTLQTVDYFAIYDNSAAGTRRISYSNLISELNNDLTFSSVSFGADNQIPYTNSTTDDFDYSLNLTFTGSLLTLGGKELINQTAHGTHGLEVTYLGPSVTTNTTNYDIGVNVDARYNYDITAGDTDSGYRIGLNVAVHCDTADFLGTLTNEYGIRIQYGQHTSSGAGTITNVYGLYFQFLDGGAATITNKYSIYSGSTDAMMYHAGNVGIAASPQTGYYKLTIGGSTELIGSESGSLDLRLNNTHADGSTRFLMAVNSLDEYIVMQINYGGDGIFKGTSGAIIWGWDSSENMGIGTTDTMSNAQLFVSTNKSTGFATHFFNDGNDTGRYGIKVQCGQDDQSQAGTQAMYMRCYDGDGGDEGAIIVDTGTLQFLQASDARRKTNIEDVYLDVQKTLSNIRVREFDMLRKDGKTAGGHQIGWIAQEVNKVYPEMVNYVKDSDMYGIKPGVITPLLHRGWQLHEERLNKLESDQDKIKRLERRVKYLENKLK